MLKPLNLSYKGEHDYLELFKLIEIQLKDAFQEPWILEGKNPVNDLQLVLTVKRFVIISQFVSRGVPTKTIYSVANKVVKSCRFLWHKDFEYTSYDEFLEVLKLFSKVNRNQRVQEHIKVDSS